MYEVKRNVWRDGVGYDLIGKATVFSTLGKAFGAVIQRLLSGEDGTSDETVIWYSIYQYDDEEDDGELSANVIDNMEYEKGCGMDGLKNTLNQDWSFHGVPCFATEDEKRIVHARFIIF